MDAMDQKVQESALQVGGCRRHMGRHRRHRGVRGTGGTRGVSGYQNAVCWRDALTPCGSRFDQREALCARLHTTFDCMWKLAFLCM